MKAFLTLLALLTLNSFNLLAQWQPDVRLTNDPGASNTSLSNAWCIASRGDVVHVVWYDNRNGNSEIYYKRSTDNGVSWGVDTRLTNDPAFSGLPSISVSDQYVHVVWEDLRNGNYEIYYKRSTDTGVNWGADMRLTNDTTPSEFPSISTSGSVVHVVWEDNPNGMGEIYYKRSTDAGASWTYDTRLTNNFADSKFPSISESGSYVHVVWYDYRDGNYEIYYKRSTDGGTNWGPDIRLTNNIESSGYPSIATFGSFVHVVWSDNRDGNYEIYYKRSTDGGINWGSDTRLTNNSSNSEFPSVSVYGSNVHTVWMDDRDGNYEIYYKRSTDSGISWSTDIRLTNDPGASGNSSLTISGQGVNVVWEDLRDGNWEIYYKRNPTGNPIGIININSEIPKEFSLSQNYPNPFNPETKIKFDIPSIGIGRDLSLQVYDILGREVATLVNERLKPGTYEVEWDATNFPSGVYYYKLTAEDYSETKKMALIK